MRPATPTVPDKRPRRAIAVNPTCRAETVKRDPKRELG